MSNQANLDQAMAGHTAWENQVLAQINAATPAKSVYLLGCAKQVFARRIHDEGDYDKPFANDLMARHIFPVSLIITLQEYEETAQYIDTIKNFINTNGGSNLANHKKYEMIQNGENTHQLSSNLCTERNTVWLAVRQHPYYRSLYSQLTTNPAIDRAALQAVLQGFFNDVWDFFNRRYTFIILRSINPSLAPSTDRDYTPTLLLTDSNNFGQTNAAYEAWAAPKAEKEKRTRDAIRERWPLEKWLREKILREFYG